MSFGDSPQFIALQGVTLSNWLHVFHLFWVSFESQGFLQEEGGWLPLVAIFEGTRYYPFCVSLQ